MDKNNPKEEEISGDLCSLKMNSKDMQIQNSHVITIMRTVHNLDVCIKFSDPN